MKFPKFDFRDVGSRLLELRVCRGYSPVLAIAVIGA